MEYISIIESIDEDDLKNLRKILTNVYRNNLFSLRIERSWISESFKALGVFDGQTYHYLCYINGTNPKWLNQSQVTQYFEEKGL